MVGSEDWMAEIEKVRKLEVSGHQHSSTMRLTFLAAHCEKAWYGPSRPRHGLGP